MNAKFSSIVLAFLFPLILIPTSCLIKERKVKVIQCSTSSLPYHDLQNWINYDHPIFGDVCTFIDGQTINYVVIKGLQSIIFPLKPLIDSLHITSNPTFSYAIDSLFSIVSFYYNGENNIYKIDRKGKLIRKLVFIDDRSNQDSKIQLFWKFVPLHKKTGSTSHLFVCNFAYDFLNSHTYQIDPKVRKRMFSRGALAELELQDTILRIKRELGSYPKHYINERLTYYYYEPVDFAVNEKNEILCCFPTVDSLLWINGSGSSSLKKIDLINYKKVSTFPNGKLFDYTFISKYSCENNFLLYIQTWHHKFYLISTIASKFEDNVNLSEGPWELYEIKNDFSIQKIDIGADMYSKHFSFTTSNSFYFLNKNLSTNFRSVFHGFQFE